MLSDIGRTCAHNASLAPLLTFTEGVLPSLFVVDPRNCLNLLMMVSLSFTLLVSVVSHFHSHYLTHSLNPLVVFQFQFLILTGYSRSDVVSTKD